MCVSSADHQQNFCWFFWLFVRFLFANSVIHRYNETNIIHKNLDKEITKRITCRVKIAIQLRTIAYICDVRTLCECSFARGQTEFSSVGVQCSVFDFYSKLVFYFYFQSQHKKFLVSMGFFFLSVLFFSVLFLRRHRLQFHLFSFLLF